MAQMIVIGTRPLVKPDSWVVHVIKGAFTYALR